MMENLERDNTNLKIYIEESKESGKEVVSQEEAGGTIYMYICMIMSLYKSCVLSRRRRWESETIKPTNSLVICQTKLHQPPLV